MNRNIFFLNQIDEYSFELEDKSGVNIYSKINSDEDGKRLYISLNNINSIKEPVKPLGIDILNRMFPFGDYDDRGKSLLVKDAGGIIYIDITDFFRFPIRKDMLQFFSDNMDKQVVKEMYKSVKNNKFSRRKSTYRMVKDVSKIISYIKKEGVSKAGCKYKPECNYEINLIIESIIDGIEDEVKKVNNSKMIVPYDFNCRSLEECLEERVEFIRRRMECVKQLLPAVTMDVFQYIGPYVYAEIISYKQLISILRKNHIDINIVHKIMKGCRGSIQRKMNLKISQLADLIHEDEEIIKILKENPKQAYELMIEKGYSELNEKLERFLLLYGMKAQDELDIANKRYEEDFSFISKSILHNIYNMKKDEAKDCFDNSIKEAQECEEKILKLMNNKVKVKNDIENIRAFAYTKEYIEYALMKIFRVIKSIIFEGAEYLVEMDLIDDKNDSGFLEIDEIIYAINNNKNVKEVVKVRKEKYKMYNQLYMPKIINFDKEIY